VVATILAIEEIVSDPTVRSGRPVVGGTGICVSDLVVWQRNEALTLAELVALERAQIVE